MEEKELTLSQYFSVVKKHWKTFVIVLLSTIVVVSAILFILNAVMYSNKKTISIKNNIDLVEELETTKYTYVYNAVANYYGNDQTKIDSEKVNKINKAITISKNEDESGENAYDVEIDKVNYKSNSGENVSFTKDELTGILNCFIEELNNVFAIPKEQTTTVKDDEEQETFTNTDITQIVNYKAVNSEFTYNSEKEIIENLLTFREKIIRLNKKIELVNKTYTTIKDYTDINKNNLTKIKSKIATQLVGSVDYSDTLEDLTWYVINNSLYNTSTDSATYKSFLDNFMNNNDKFGIAEIYVKLNELNDESNPDTYKTYSNKLSALGSEKDIYDNNYSKITQAIKNWKDIEIINENDFNTLKSKIDKLVTLYNEIVNDYNAFLDNAVSYYTDMYEIQVENNNTIFGFMKIAIFDAVAVIVVFIIVYIVFFIKMKKNNELEFITENTGFVK